MKETKARSSVAGRQISIEIGRVVVHDSPFQVGSGERLGHMIESALRQRVETHGLPREFAAAEILSVRVPSAPVSGSGQAGYEGVVDSRDQQMAHAVAAGVYHALGRTR